jgi:predicted aminopeptidase
MSGLRRSMRWAALAVELALMAVIVWSAFHRSLVLYGLDQARGQLRLVEEIRRFAVDSLGLTPTRNYSTYYDQHGQPLLWVLTAAAPFALKAYEWEFPFLGRVSYKGFFDYDNGRREERRLAGEGFDTEYATVSAWSTLGWFRDPVLSGMLKRSDGALADLIIHEMTHGVVYQKSEVNFNENLASAVGEAGAVRFLTARFGKGAPQLEQYLRQKGDADLYSAYMLASARRLDSLYAGLQDTASTWDKKKQKDSLMQEISRGLQSVPFAEPERWLPRRSRERLNNAVFLSYIRYDKQKDSLRQVLNSRYGGNVGAFLRAMKAAEED